MQILFHIKWLPSQFHSFFAALKTDAGVIASAGLTSNSGSTPITLLAHQAAVWNPCTLRQGIRYCCEGWVTRNKSIGPAKQPLASPICIRSNKSGIPCSRSRNLPGGTHRRMFALQTIARRKTFMLKALSVNPAFSQAL